MYQDSSMKQRGSAILIAVLLLAALGGVAFGIGRMLYFDTGLANRYENSVIAYYAAESGIEEGMLRYRYDKNEQVPDSAGSFDNTRMNLNDLTLPTNAQTTVPVGHLPSNLQKRFYGMQMSYLGPYYGVNVNNYAGFNMEDVKNSNYTDHNEFRIPRDENIKIDVTNLSPDKYPSNDLQLYVKPVLSSCTSQPISSVTDLQVTRHFIETKVTGKNTQGNTEERKVALLMSTTTPTRNTEISAVVIDSGVMKYQNLLHSIKLSEFGNPDYSTFSDSTSVELSLKAIGCDYFIGMNPSPLTNMISQPFTLIKSTGYYGGQTRTLEAKIDRQAGTVYDLFDYVIYDRN